MFRRQMVIFILVGALTTVLDIGLLKALMCLGVNYAIATSLAFCAALVFNYVAHARVTFQSMRTKANLMRFLATVLFNYLLTLTFVVAGHNWFDSVLAGKFASIPVVAATGFLLNRYWVFRKKIEPPVISCAR